MKIKLVFGDWQKEGRSIYQTPEGIELTKGDFHAGSTFDARIDVDAWQEKELRDALKKGYQPVFWVVTKH